MRLRDQLEQEGINLRALEMSGLAEEAPQDYKNLSRVVETVSKVGIAHKVAPRATYSRGERLKKA